MRSGLGLRLDLHWPRIRLRWGLRVGVGLVGRVCGLCLGWRWGCALGGLGLKGGLGLIWGGLISGGLRVFKGIVSFVLGWLVWDGFGRGLGLVWAWMWIGFAVGLGWLHWIQDWVKLSLESQGALRVGSGRVHGWYRVRSGSGLVRVDFWVSLGWAQGWFRVGFCWA